MTGPTVPLPAMAQSPMRLLEADYNLPDAMTRIPFFGGAATEVCDRLDRYGFAVVNMGHITDYEATSLTGLASELSLGDPVVPILYKKRGGERYSAPVTRIGVSGGGHNGFHTAAGQELHVDGLLDPIGSLPTTILLCVRPAVSGGRTTVFNSSAAFARLCDTDPEAARSLMSDDALERRATLPGLAEHSTTGPAFRLNERGTIQSRYSDNETCIWGGGRPSVALRRGLSYLRAAAQDSRYFTKLLLTAGEALVFRNDQIAHGREPFVNNEAAPRALIRAIYANAPSATQTSSARKY